MKILIKILLIAGLSYLSLQYFPWWSAGIISFVVAFLLTQRPKRRIFGNQAPPTFNFFIGFIALFLLWGLTAFSIDIQNQSLLSGKIAQLLMSQSEPVENGSYLMILASACVGGMIGGFAAMTGGYLAKAVKVPS